MVKNKFPALEKGLVHSECGPGTKPRLWAGTHSGFLGPSALTSQNPVLPLGVRGMWDMHRVP